jgi:hypothetical protein
MNAQKSPIQLNSTQFNHPSHAQRQPIKADQGQSSPIKPDCLNAVPSTLNGGRVVEERVRGENKSDSALSGKSIKADQGIWPMPALPSEDRNEFQTPSGKNTPASRLCPCINGVPKPG